MPEPGCSHRLGAARFHQFTALCFGDKIVFSFYVFQALSCRFRWWSLLAILPFEETKPVVGYSAYIKKSPMSSVSSPQPFCQFKFWIEQSAGGRLSVFRLSHNP
jgi:hypothetical protein